MSATYYGESEFNEKVTFHNEVNLSGNVYFSSGNIIIKSNNGVRFKLIVSDSGVLSTTPL